MALPQLRALAHRLAVTEQCRFIAPEATQASEFDHHAAPTDGRDLDDVFDQIDQPGAWIALYNIETDPQYQEFLSELRAAFEPLLAGQQTGITNVGGFVFISCAPSVTPFHIDRENNFWLQILGTKTISVWPANEPHVMAPASVEKFILNRDLTDVRLSDAIQPYRNDFEMRPGKGLYFPSLTPHMTRCDEPAPNEVGGPSISIGVVFYSDQTRQQSRALAFNRLLRRVGLNPQIPPLTTADQPQRLLDVAHAAAGRLLVQAMKKLRGFAPPPGL